MDFRVPPSIPMSKTDKGRQENPVKRNSFTLDTLIPLPYTPNLVKRILSDKININTTTFPKKEQMMPGNAKHKYQEFKHPRFLLATARDILFDAIKNYRNNGDTNQAAAISLYGILSLIPLFILTLIVADKFFGSYPNIQREVIEGMQGFNPFFSETLLKQLGRLEQKKQVLGWLGILSLIWFSAMIFRSVETAMTIIFHSPAKRNYLLSRLLAISMIPTGWAVCIVSIRITYISMNLAKQSMLSSGLIFPPFFHGGLIRYVLPYLIMVTFFTIVYKVLPKVKVDLDSAFAGAAVFSALMEIAKHFFTWYVSNYTHYNIIFGSLETVVILMIWVFYMALIFLFCAEIISSYQRRNLILLEKAFLLPGKKLVKIEKRLFEKFGRIYPKGTYIFKEGDRGREMFYILMGKVRVEKNAGQVKKILPEMGPGDYFGEMAALIKAPRTASVLAMEDSNVAVISHDTFRNLLRESGEVSLFMLKEFSNRLKYTNHSLEELTQSSIKQTVLHYFLNEWPLPQDRTPLEDLCRYTRKEPEEILQVLKELHAQHIITIHDGKITEFRKEIVRDLLNKEFFFSERRGEKRPIDIYI